MPHEPVINHPQVIGVQKIAGLEIVIHIARHTEVDMLLHTKLQVVKINFTFKQSLDAFFPKHIKGGPFGTKMYLLFRLPDIAHTGSDVQFYLVIGGIVSIKVHGRFIG